MVHCPQCGAANPEGNKLCNECGNDLPVPSSGVRCPMCSHNNPLGSEVCEQCNARLVPLTASPSLQEQPSLTRDEVPSPSPEPEPTARIEPPAEAPSVTEAEFDEGAPDWLQRMRASVPSGEPAPLGWSDEAEPELPAEPSDRPDWLDRLGPAETPPSAPSAPEALASESPDWLRRLESPATTPPAEPSPGERPGDEVPDWLGRLEQEQEASTAEVEPGAPPSAGADVPDWLAEMPPGEAEQTVPPPAEGEVPEWLEELAAIETEPAAPPSPADAEVPDWLAEMASVEAEPGAPPPSADTELADWLADMAPAEAEPAIPSPTAEAELPDWLWELASAEPEPAVPPPSAETGVPDWVAEMAPTEAGPIAPPPIEAEVPDWLAEMVAPDEAEAETPPSAVEPTAPLAAAEMPDWLTAETPARPAEGLAAPTAPLAEERMPPPSFEPEPDEVAPTGELPEWLTELEPIEAGPMSEEGILAQAEIPDWLQAMRPGVTPAPPLEDEGEEVEASGLLAGIANVVRAASIFTAPPSAPAKPEPIIIEATLARASLWQELIARSAHPSPLPLPQVHARRARDRIERWLVYGIVALAVCVPIFAGIELSNLLSLNEPLTTDAGAAYEFINERVVEGTPVLVAFDYAPSYMGELHSQAKVLLHHLVHRQARIIAVSLKPEGAGLAQQLVDDVLSERNYRPGQDYVNLGYVPGEAVGIRSLEYLPRQFHGKAFDGRDLEDMAVFGDDTDFALSKVSLIVVLTGDANDLRWWIEQTTALERDLPLVAGVSAAIEPLVRPYYDMEAPQIDGLVVGLAGAVDYESKLDWQDGPAHVRISGQLVGQVAVLALILIGMLRYGFSRESDSAS